MQITDTTRANSEQTTFFDNDWIRITTTTATTGGDSGWHSINWGPSVSQAPKEPTTFYSYGLKQNLEIALVVLPKSIPYCCNSMIITFSKAKQTTLSKMFLSQSGAIHALASFIPTGPFEEKIFAILAKKVYTGDIRV